MSGRHIIIPPGRAVIVLTIAEVCALHTLALAMLSNEKRAREVFGGASKHTSGMSSIHAGQRATEVLADVRRAMDKNPTPEGAA
jgi:hypothetical protein